MTPVKRTKTKSDDQGAAIPFTREDMLLELRELLLIEACRIDLMRGPKATEAFIGFTLDLDGLNSENSDFFTRLDEASKKIELHNFALTRNFELAYDYAFQIGSWASYDEAIDTRLGSVAQSFPSFWGVVGRMIEHSPYHLENSKCRHVVDMASARLRLFVLGEGLKIRQLALLANMKEPAVRNSLSSDGIKTEGKRGLVDAERALTWLSDRRGYIPTKAIVEQSRDIPEYTARVLQENNFADALRLFAQEQGVWRPGDSLTEAVTRASSVDSKFVQQLVDGVPALITSNNAAPSIDIDSISRVGRALNIDVPKFVASAVELALRLSHNAFLPRDGSEQIDPLVPTHVVKSKRRLEV